MKYLMPLVGEERGGGHKQTSITIAGGIGVVNVPYGGQVPGRGIICKTTGVVVALNAGALLERSMARETQHNWNWEGNVTEGGDNGDPLIADEGEAFFFVYNRAPRERKEAGTMPSTAMGAASPWFLVRAQKPADGESEPN
jgi:hypothetical protein